jgi:hypothetical protein
LPLELERLRRLRGLPVLEEEAQQAPEFPELHAVARVRDLHVEELAGAELLALPLVRAVEPVVLLGATPERAVAHLHEVEGGH